MQDNTLCACKTFMRQIETNCTCISCGNCWPCHSQQVCYLQVQLLIDSCNLRRFLRNSTIRHAHTHTLHHIATPTHKPYTHTHTRNIIDYRYNNISIHTHIYIYINNIYIYIYTQRHTVYIIFVFAVCTTSCFLHFVTRCSPFGTRLWLTRHTSALTSTVRTARWESAMILILVAVVARVCKVFLSPQLLCHLW